MQLKCVMLRDLSPPLFHWLKLVPFRQSSIHDQNSHSLQNIQLGIPVAAAGSPHRGTDLEGVSHHGVWRGMAAQFFAMDGIDVYRNNFVSKAIALVELSSRSDRTGLDSPGGSDFCQPSHDGGSVRRFVFGGALGAELA